MESISYEIIRLISFKSVIGRNIFGQATHAFDFLIEQTLVKHLRKFFPSYAIFAEEKGWYGGKKEEGIIVIDPVDGSRNCYHDIPFWAISIAVLFPNQIDITNVKAAIIWAPLLHECFIAEKNKGAYLVIPNKVMKLPHVIPIEKYSPIAVTLSENEIKYLVPLKQIGIPRHLGSISLELAYTAAGRFLATVSLSKKIRLIDVLAGALLIKESNGFFKVIEKSDNRVSFIATLKEETLLKILSFLKRD